MLVHPADLVGEGLVERCAGPVEQLGGDEVAWVHLAQVVGERAAEGEVGGVDAVEGSTGRLATTYPV